MMDTVKNFLLGGRLAEPEDIEALLDLADLVRAAVGCEKYQEIREIINYCVENGCFEALSWTMEILQEELGKAAECRLEDFDCDMGMAIKHYNDFVQQLGIDLNVLTNEVEAIRDDNGEVQSFFNIFSYKTRFENVFFVSSENFDTKDNDFIRYKLSFKRTV